MMRYWNGMGMGMNGLWFLLLLIILIIVGLLVYMFLKGNQTRNQDDSANSSKDRALRILDERFARGEISEEEYLRRKELLLRNGSE